MNWTVVQRILGLLLMMFSLTMLPPVLVAILFNEEAWLPFVEGFGITLAAGDVDAPACRGGVEGDRGIGQNGRFSGEDATTLTGCRVSANRDIGQRERDTLVGVVYPCAKVRSVSTDGHSIQGRILCIEEPPAQGSVVARDFHVVQRQDGIIVDASTFGSCRVVADDDPLQCHLGAGAAPRHVKGATLRHIHIATVLNGKITDHRVATNGNVEHPIQPATVDDR